MTGWAAQPMRLGSAALAVVVFLACHPWMVPRQKLLDQGSCEFGFLCLVIPGPGEACYVALLRERCGPGDSCLVECITSGRARDIGGGCYHLCNYGGKRWPNWQLPGGHERCFSNP